MERRLAAVVMADLVGYSRLIEADEAGTLAILKERRTSVLDPTVRAHGRRIVKVMGASVTGYLLDVPRDVPCLALHRRSWSGGQVVTVATLLYPGNRYALHSRYRTGAAGTISSRS